MFVSAAWFGISWILDLVGVIPSIERVRNLVTFQLWDLLYQNRWNNPQVGHKTFHRVRHCDEKLKRTKQVMFRLL